LPRGLARRLVIAGAFVARTVPHLVRTVRRGDVPHVQGLFLHPVMLALLFLLRLRAGRVVHSPHNTFIRYRLPLGETWLRLFARVADATIVFSKADAERVARWGGRPVVAPLAQYMPPPEESSVRRWRERWAADGAQVVLFAGQLRSDKRLDLLIEAARDWPPGRRLAVVGEDKGELESCRELARSAGVQVSWQVGFTPLDEFVAALAAADLVVCPYDAGSQSGVLALARQLGTASVASDAGGLSELADRSFPAGDAAALASAIDVQLERPAPAASADGSVAAPHLEAYAMAPTRAD
jgi:glycosyltransferase involved in cell wall biosynthesis